MNFWNFRLHQCLLFIFIAYPCFLFSQDSDDLLPSLSTEQYTLFLLSHSKQFPSLGRVIFNSGPGTTLDVINSYTILRRKIVNSRHYDDFLQKASFPLLTIEVTREVDQKQTQSKGIDNNFLTQWRDDLIRLATQNRFSHLNNTEGNATKSDFQENPAYFRKALPLGSSVQLYGRLGQHFR